MGKHHTGIQSHVIAFDLEYFFASLGGDVLARSTVRVRIYFAQPYVFDVRVPPWIGNEHEDDTHKHIHARTVTSSGVIKMREDVGVDVDENDTSM